MATMLSFPVQHACPTCNRPCSDEDLSECLRCGQQYCSQDSWECDCDRTAREIIERGGTSDEGISVPENIGR
jgi:hypothetical protein